MNLLNTTNAPSTLQTVRRGLVKYILAGTACVLLPTTAWATASCKQLTSPQVSIDGSLGGTYDPENYKVGDLIREIRLVRTRAGEYSCSGGAAPDMELKTMAGVYYYSYSMVKQGDFFVSPQLPGFGFRFVSRLEDGTLYYNQYGSEETISTANLDGIPFSAGAASGIIGRVEVYKLTNEAKDIDYGQDARHIIRYREQVGLSGGPFSPCSRDCFDVTVGSGPGVRLKLTAVDKPTCSIPVPNVRIDGIKIALKSQAAVLAEKRFSIDLLCKDGQAGVPVDIEFSMYDARAETGWSKQLTLSPSSTAKGVSIEISRGDGTPITFDKTGTFAWREGQAVVGTRAIPFIARVVSKPGEALGAGEFEAQAVYTMMYY
jgi:type 1 fimbria pilin